MILLASILLTLAGYSTGAALAARSRKRIADPGLRDCALVALAWVCEMVHFRSAPKPALSLVIALIISAAVAFVIHSSFYSRSRFKTAGSGEFVFLTSDHTANTAQPLWQRAWNGWKNFAAESADFQGRLLVSLVYFTLLWPFSFFAPSAASRHQRNSNWQPRAISADPVKDSQRQF